MRTDSDGQPSEIYGTVTDITERRALEEAEREAALRLREFSRTMPGVGMIVDSSGKIVEVFDDNQLLSKDSATNWLGQSFFNLLPMEPARQLVQEIGYAIDQDMLRFGEYTLELDRGRRMFEVRIAPLSYRQEGKATAACYWTVLDGCYRSEAHEETVGANYGEIGVFQFLPAVLDSDHVKDFVQRTLGKLAEYDRIQGTELMHTLEKILQTDNLKMVAKQFYVHRQTVLFRKRRIETVLGVSLDDFETRLALGMALKFRQVFGEDE